MLLCVLFAFVGTTLWATLSQVHRADVLQTVFFLTVAASWAVVIPAKFWSERGGDPWSRRLVMLVLGGLLGGLAFWLDGGAAPAEGPFTGPRTWGPPRLMAPAAPDSAVAGGLPATLFEAGTYLIYFGLAFFAVRWWQMVELHRPARFSFFPILAAGFWALMLLALVPHHLTRGAAALVQTAAIVQLVSPWAASQPRAARRLRLRYASQA
jgi:hypothetical protein